MIVHSDLSAQKTKATLIFKDGTKMEGYGKRIIGDRIKFKTDKKARTRKYHFSELEKAIILDGDYYSTYVYLGVKQDNFKVFKELAVGKVNLYLLETSGYSGPMYVGGAGNTGGWVGGQGYQIKNLFVQRYGQNELIHLGSNQLFTKNFKKAATAFFKDCPELAKKIQDKTYRKSDIKNVVEFYNNQCELVDAK